MEWMLMPLKRYFEFSGRSRRMEYWMWIVLQIIISTVMVTILMVLGSSAAFIGDPGAIMAMGGAVLVIFALYALLSLVFFIPSLAVTVRRLHDTNRSGLWILGVLVPYIIIFLAFGMAGSAPSQESLAMAGLITMVASLFILGFGVTLLVFMFLEGTPGPNRYGPDPKNRTAAQVFA